MAEEAAAGVEAEVEVVVVVWPAALIMMMSWVRLMTAG